VKQVSIQDLKAHLSATVAEAEGGETILVARHGDVVARLGPAHAATVHRGRRVGSRLLPAVARGTGGRYLAVLLDDRGGR
jgi:antitoxin (DNA-binding transcriptional repressor) of toxin-antitoxin stability system